MASKYDTSKGTKVSVSKIAGAILGATAKEDMVNFSCTVKDMNINRGQKSDIDVTTLCSEETENINGLPGSGEVTANVNWVAGDEGQKILNEAYENDTLHEFEILLKSGNGFRFLGEVRQADVSIAVNGIVTGSYTFRVKGKVQQFEAEPAAAGFMATKAAK